MTSSRLFIGLLVRLSIALLLIGLIAMPQTASFAQDIAPVPPAADEVGEAEEEGQNTPVDPRIKAAQEEARRLRIERQTTLTSSPPTESGVLTSLAIPEALVGSRGLRYGSFVLLPVLTFAAAYTDNVGAADEDRDEDLSVNATGLIRAQSVLPRHEFGVDARGTTSHSFQAENEDYFDWQVGAETRLDLTRKSRVFGRVDYSLDTEDDSSADAESNANDIESINGNVGYGFAGNKIGYTLNLDVARQDFSGENSADRDTTTYGVSQRIDHKTTPRLTLFVSPQYSYTKFDEEIADDGEGRDSHSATGLIGADMTLRSLVTLSTAVGYTRLFFEDSGREDTDSAVANALLGWQASPQLNLQLAANHELELTTVDGADASATSSLQLAANRLIGLDMSLLGEVGVSYTDFKDSSRSDLDLNAGVGLARRLTENLFLSLAYRYQQRFADEGGTDFYENQALLGLSIIY